MGAPSTGGWDPCPQGELVKLAGRLAARRRWQFLMYLSFGAAVAGATGLGATAVVTTVWPSNGHRGGCCGSQSIGGTAAGTPAPDCPTPTPQR